MERNPYLHVVSEAAYGAAAGLVGGVLERLAIEVPQVIHTTDKELAKRPLLMRINWLEVGLSGSRRALMNGHERAAVAIREINKPKTPEQT